jgi:hypothetical protein
MPFWPGFCTVSLPSSCAITSGMAIAKDQNQPWEVWWHVSGCTTTFTTDICLSGDSHAFDHASQNCMSMQEISRCPTSIFGQADSLMR